MSNQREAREPARDPGGGRSGRRLAIVLAVAVVASLVVYTLVESKLIEIATEKFAGSVLEADVKIDGGEAEIRNGYSRTRTGQLVEGFPKDVPIRAGLKIEASTIGVGEAAGASNVSLVAPGARVEELAAYYRSAMRARGWTGSVKPVRDEDDDGHIMMAFRKGTRLCTITIQEIDDFDSGIVIIVQPVS